MEQDYLHYGVPPRIRKIERLMRDLEAGPREPNSGDIQTMQDARQLILDLLNMSDKPQGELLYAHFCRRALEEQGSGGPGELRDMIRFCRRWLPEAMPADEGGKVHFVRALVESLLVSAEAHLEREAKRAGLDGPASVGL